MRNYENFSYNARQQFAVWSRKKLVNWVTNTNIEIDVLRPKAFPRSVKEEVIRQASEQCERNLYHVASF